MQNNIIANRYRIYERVYETSLSIDYKASDEKKSLPVIIRLFKGKNKPLETLLRFRKDLEQISKIEHLNLLKIYDIGEYEGSNFVATEDCDAPALSHYLTKPIAVDTSVDIILQIATGLELIHQKGIVHRAVNPSGIIALYLDDKITVKLGNFGVGLLLDLANVKSEEEIITAFGYMSPEVTGILRKPIDARSDIYSLGILFYQLITGELPYKEKEVASLIHQHIAQKPTLPREINKSIPQIIERIALRLIAKDPQDRYQSLPGLIADLKEYQRQASEGKKDIEFEIARSDRLKELNYSTRLIGREKELEQLKSYIEEAKESKGSLCLVYGEAGIGKSRLIDELRGYIYGIKGIFIGGKCYQYEFKTPYKVFIEAIEAYIEKINRVSKEQRESSVSRIKEALGELGGEVLKLTPKIKELIGEPPELVKIEPEKEQIRFLITITNFILSLGTADNPIVLFLDDLQWADEGSIELLGRIARKISSYPVVTLASFRDNEVSVGHPLKQALEKLKQENIPVPEIPVKPFVIEDTRRIASQILLEKEEEISALSEELYQRTKGNPFFVLELLRAFVDEGMVYLKDNHYQYDSSKLKAASLPTNIVEMVLKRVKEISTEDMKILSYASVMGREMQFELLLDLTKLPQGKVLNTVEEGIRSQFLMRDITGKENIYFVHDRIRQAFYEQVTEEERIPLHRHIASVMEEQHKDNPEPILYELAYHFTQGQVEEKALTYSIKAADKAKANYANQQAIALYIAAKQLLEKQHNDKGNEYIEVLESLGEVYRLAGRFEEALEALRACESLIPGEDKIHKARVLSMMGDTLWDNGKVEESAKVLEQALVILKRRFFRSRLGVIFGILKEFNLQIMHMLLPGIFISGKFRASERDLIAIRILNRLGHVYYFSDVNKTFYLILKSLNFSEQIGPCPELVFAYIDGIALWGTLPIRQFMERSFRRAIELCRKINNVVLEGIGYGYYAIFGYLVNNPREGIKYAQKAIDILRSRGEFWDLGTAYVFRGNSSWIYGRLKESISETQEMIDVMKQANALQGLGWGLAAKGRLFAVLGDFYPGITTDVKKAYELMVKTMSKNTMVQFQGILSFVHSRMQQYDKAIEAARKVRELFPSHYNKGPWSLEALPEGAQAYLDCIANTPDFPYPQKKNYLKEAEWFIFNSRLYSLLLMFPFIRGWAYQVWGTYNWLNGRKKRAEKLWDKGLHWLRTNKNNPGADKYRIAYILLEEAKFLLQDNLQDKKAYSNLIEAKGLFEEMGCVLDMVTTNKLLKSIEPARGGVDNREALTVKRHLESLLNVTQSIGSILVLEELLDKIMDHALKVTGAERGFLFLYDENNNLTLQVGRGIEKELKGQIFSYETYKISLKMIKDVEKTKQAIVTEEEDKGSKVISELKNYGIRQVLCAPLIVRDKALGIIYLDNSFARGMFGAEELELMKSFAMQASVSIENAYLVKSIVEQERLKQEMELGRQIQMGLLPKESPDVQGLKVCGLMEPAKEIGGDYYDYLPKAKDRLAVVIGDVSGKGVAAGLLMAVAKTAIYTISSQTLSPKNILISTNDILYQHMRGEKFMTLLYLEYSNQTKKLIYSSAGHEHILHYDLKQNRCIPIKSGGFMLGMLPDVADMLEEREISLSPGDKIILYTDGVTEAENNKRERFGLNQLIQATERHSQKSAQELLDNLYAEVKTFMGNYPQYDDITLITMEVGG